MPILHFIGGDGIYHDLKGTYELPENLSMYTDGAYNEIVMNTLMVDENGQMKKMQPDYVIYIKDRTEMTLEELENDAMWVNSKKVAGQFGIPIVMVDRQKVQEAEKTKISAISEKIKGGEYTTQDLIQFVQKVTHYTARYGEESILEYAPKDMVEFLREYIEKRKSEEIKDKKISTPQIGKVLTPEEIASRRQTILERQERLQEDMKTIEGEEK